ncbi:MAG: hypothetical protein KBD23_01930 [Gammaproteobacteria bacterium]|nr:hypothetical protein [Gammaproteobacteria bacterium]MBP9728883.1 hypothetical protein [Gammaproteobacteria bacterium]
MHTVPDDTLEPFELFADDQYEKLELFDEFGNPLDELLGGLDEVGYSNRQVLSADSATQQSYALPSLIFRLTADKLVIEKQVGQNLQRLFATQLQFSAERSVVELGAFADAFVVSLYADHGFSLQLDNLGFNIKLFSTVPVVLRKPLKIGGDLHLQVPNLSIDKNVEIEAKTLKTQGTLINRGRLYAEEMVLERASGQAKDLTLDNEEGYIVYKEEIGSEEEPVCKLRINHGTVLNQKGEIRGHQVDIAANRVIHF